MSSYENEVERLKFVDDRNEFIRRYYRLYKSLKYFLYPVSVGLCVLLTAAHLYVNYISWINSVFITALFAGLLAVFLEVFKKQTSDVVFDGARAGDYEKKGRLIVFWLAVVGFAGSFGYGIYFDFAGAPVVTEYVKNNTTPLDSFLINIDKINEKYDLKIAALNQTQSGAMNTKWKGNVTRDGIMLSRKIEDSKNKIEDQRNAELEKAEKKNNDRKLKYNAAMSSSSHWVRGILTMVILVQFIFFWFDAIYNDIGRKELGNIVSKKKVNEGQSSVLNLETENLETEDSHTYGTSSFLGFAEGNKLYKKEPQGQDRKNAVSILPESTQRFSETENRQKKQTENVIISVHRTGQKKEPDAQKIVKFIKRFRGRYLQGIVNENEKTRTRNANLAKKDWAWLEANGYNVKTDEANSKKLIITKK